MSKANSKDQKIIEKHISNGHSIETLRKWWERFNPNGSVEVESDFAEVSFIRHGWNREIIIVHSRPIW